jgi:hypothetical protein
MFVIEKLNNGFGIFLISIVAAGFGYLLANNLFFGVGVVGALVSLFVLVLCLLSLEWGIYINLIFLFLSSQVSRMFFIENLPFGIISDGLLLATFAGIFIRKNQAKEISKNFFSKPPIFIYLIVLGYLLLQFFNPYGHSIQGGLNIIRKVIGSIVVIYICYTAFNTYARIYNFLRVLFVCAFLAGLYGCIQQWHGLFSFETAWVHSDELRLNLIYLFGVYRKFSFFSGPTEFGIIMASCSLLFILIGLSEKKLSRKIILIGGSIIMLLGMSYSGTRTANAMFVGGVVIYILLTINKVATRIFAIIAILAFLFIMFAPIYTSETIYRFRSSFSAKEDNSYNVREANRASVQPYIYTHPFGGGLSTTGENGRKYNPGHQNAGFPTDSSYLGKALEIGWIGLILTCILYFATIQFAVRGFFATNDTRGKSILAACVAFLFCYYIGEIAQEAIGQFSNTFVYYPIIAIIIRISQLSSSSQSEEFKSSLNTWQN